MSGPWIQCTVDDDDLPDSDGDLVGDGFGLVRMDSITLVTVRAIEDRSKERTVECFARCGHGQMVTLAEYDLPAREALTPALRMMARRITQLIDETLSSDSAGTGSEWRLEYRDGEWTLVQRA